MSWRIALVVARRAAPAVLAAVTGAAVDTGLLDGSVGQALAGLLAAVFSGL